MTAETSNARGDWVLVPREPTAEMVQASDDISCRAEGAEHWAAMLAAAPPPPADAEVRARELLAAEYDADDLCYTAQAIREGETNIEVRAALRAIVAALSQQPEARGVVDVEAIRRACQSGKRFWQAGPGYYEEIESLLPALTEARNVR